MTDSKEDGLTISVEREDLEDGSITYHLWDTANGDYKWIVGLNDDKLAQGGKSKFYAERIALAVNALSASSPPVGGSGEVVVKALDWGETSYGRPEASTVVGVYRIYESVSGGWSASRGGLHADVLKDKDGRKNFATLDAAKAAAQADYETRIRSALAAPVPNGVPEGAGREAGLREALVQVEAVRVSPQWSGKHADWICGAVRFEIEQLLLSALSASPVTPEGLSGGGRATHRHKKRGSEYVLIGFGRMQSGNWHQTERRHDTTIGSWLVVGQPADMREVAIYRSIDDGGLLWVRPRDEFEDGRFEAIV